MDDSIFQIKELVGCRACMKENIKNDMVYLFDIKNIENNLFSKCTEIEIHENDELPNYICNECQQNLMKYYDFRLMCWNSDSTYKKNIPVKNELDPSEFVESIEDIKIEPLDNNDEKSNLDKSNKRSTNREISKIEVEKVDVDEVDYETDNPESDGSEYNQSDDDEEASEKSDNESENTFFTSESIKNEEDNNTSTETQQNKLKIKINRRKQRNNKGSKAVFPCTLCKRKFFVERRLEGHLRQHEGKKPAVCTLCDKEFAKWGGLDAHMINAHSNIGKPFICEEKECGRTYTMKQSLVSHVRKVHLKIVDKSSASVYICESCGKSFASAGTLKKHSYIHTGLMPFHCQLCPRKYVTKHKLKEHMMRHEGIKNHVCPVCGLKKTTLNELKVHLNYHTREKLYPCKICPSVFTSVGNMSRHYKIVHCGIKAYACTHCDRSFGKSETLKHHIMTHTGERPHGCSVCGKRFIQSVALQTHIKTHKKV